MLYNKNWDKPEVKADPFSLESLIAWLEKMPAEQEYCFMDNGDCLFFKYFSAMGVPVYSIGGDYYSTEYGGELHFFPDNFPYIAAQAPHAFGAALDRARKALAERQT